MGHFVFTLSKDDVDSATRCFQFAMGSDKGHQVDLFFNDDGMYGRIKQGVLKPAPARVTAPRTTYRIW